MKKIIKLSLAFSILMLAASSISAQEDINKVEVFGGYSYMNLNRGIDPDELVNNYSDFPGNRVNAHGFNGAFTYNFRRYLGAKFDLTLHSHTEEYATTLVPTPTGTPDLGTTGPTVAALDIRHRVYQYMAGIQVKDNKKEGSMFRPFVHVLGGFAAQNIQVDQTSPVTQQLLEFKATDFAMKFGGGADLNVHKNFSIRMIQFDYNPIFRGDIDYGTGPLVNNSIIQHNYLVSVGGVVHF